MRLETETVIGGLNPGCPLPGTTASTVTTGFFRCSTMFSATYPAYPVSVMVLSTTRSVLFPCTAWLTPSLLIPFFSVLTNLSLSTLKPPAPRSPEPLYARIWILATMVPGFPVMEKSEMSTVYSLQVSAEGTESPDFT